MGKASTLPPAKQSVGTKVDGRSSLLETARSSEKVLTCAAIVFAIFATFALRAFGIDVSYNILGDELYYLEVSRGVLLTLWVLDLDGYPFYVHPPGLFFLEAAYLKIFDIPLIRGHLFDKIHAVRYLDAALAGLSAGVLLHSGWRLAGWPAGVAAAALFALDPFSIKMNSLNLLETPSGLWILLGYGVLFSALVRAERRPVSWWRTVVAGVLFGLALLTKEVSTLVTLLPLGICFVLGWALPRTQSALVAVVALIVYAPYPAIAYARGEWVDFVDQKSSGVSRLAGLLQITGYNQRGGPSFLEAIVANLNEFATTYVLLATGAAALCVLLLTNLGRTPARQLLASWTMSAYAYLGYSIFFGTLEEQFFYYLAGPSILATTVTTLLVLQRVMGFSRHLSRAERPARATRLYRLATQAAVVILAGAVTLWNAYIWVMVHTVPDNGYQRVVSYVQRQPEGSRVAAMDEVSEILIKERGYARSLQFKSVEDLRADNIDYVVINSFLATERYKKPPLGVYRWVRNHGRLVYAFDYRGSGFSGFGACRITPKGLPLKAPRPLWKWQVEGAS